MTSLLSALVGAIAVLLAQLHAAEAQVTSAITADGTLGTTISQAGPDFAITGGTIRGGNQFHSFDRFTVGTGDSANFGGPAGIQNVLSRVTGGFGSEIDGTIGSSIAGANLFLMNPSGIIFGPNSQLDLSGSFYATTANFIGLTDGTRFNAIPSADDALLSSAAPESFGFLNPVPAPIDVNTTGLLQVPIGEALSFVGGELTLGQADFSAPAYVLAGAGRINMVSVASEGEAKLDNGAVNVDSFPRLGNVTIQGGSLVDARDVYIRGGNIVVDESLIIPGVFSFFELAPPPDGGTVDIDARGDITITGTRPEVITENPPGILTFSGSTEEISAPTDVPDVLISAGGDFTLSGFAAVQSLRFGPGTPSNMVVNARDITIDNGGGLAMFNFFEGSGGSMVVSGDNVSLVGFGEPGGTTGATGLLSQGFFHFIYGTTSIDPALANADSGSISVSASETLSVSGAAQITTDSRNFGSAESIDISARNISLSDENGFISAQSLYAGDAGLVAVEASGNVSIDNGFQIAAGSLGTGDSSGINLSAGNNVGIAGVRSGLAGQTGPPSAFQLDELASVYLGPDATFSELASELGLDPATADLIDVLVALNEFGVTDIPKTTYGDGGAIVVSAKGISVDGQNAAIDSSTAWDGNGGTVTVNADTLSVSNGAKVRSRSGLPDFDTGEFVVGSGNAGTVTVSGTGSSSVSVIGTDSAISTSTAGPGEGGFVVVESTNVSIAEGGAITASSTGAGNAGTVTILGTGLSSISVIGTDSEISTSTEGPGKGGSILLAGTNVLIAAGGQVTASSTGVGDAGNISINAGNAIRLDSKGRVSTSATIAEDGGGNIELAAPSIIYLTDSEITTSVESGIGGGGNIVIDPEFVVLNRSAVIANAFGGPGGNIRIVAENFIPSADSIVEASSARSVAGTIVIESPENNLAGAIAQLPQSFVDASGLLPEGCEAKRSGSQSSFEVVGPGGVPFDPDGYLPSFEASASIPPLPGADGSAAQAAAAERARGQAIAIVMSGLDCLSYEAAAISEVVEG